MQNRLFHRLSLVGLVAFAATGCAAETAGSESLDTSDTSSTEQGILAENVIQLTESEVAAADVEDASIVFSSPSDAVRKIKSGDTLTTVGSKRAFIRKVKSVSVSASGAVTVVTENGTLIDLAQRVKTQKKLTLPTVAIDFSGKNLAGSGRATVTCSQCSIRYTPTLDLGLDVQNRKIDHFSAEFDGDLVGKLAVAANANAAAEVNQEVEVFHATTRLVQMVGAVPIWEDVTVSVAVGFSASLGPKSKIETGVTATKRMHGGVMYDGTSWSTVQDGDVTFDYQPPTLSFDIGASAKVYVKPKLQVKLYSLAGPYLAGEAFVNVDAHVCPAPAVWSATAGLGVNVGASLDFLKVVNVSINKELYHREYEIGAGQLPGPALACSSR
jgi:hypothetical protein